MTFGASIFKDFFALGQEILLTGRCLEARIQAQEQAQAQEP
jgi:hypothetical protein